MSKVDDILNELKEINEAVREWNEPVEVEEDPRAYSVPKNAWGFIFEEDGIENITPAFDAT